MGQSREVSSNGIRTKLQTKGPITEGQREYFRTVNKNVVTFCTGPSGTGKTFVSTLFAVQQLVERKVEKIILVRPAIEAGEKIGYLPGTLEDKVYPYLRPILDILEQFYSLEELDLMRARGAIEICPIAFMRGRTLSKCVAILDEAQNTTNNQMLMFLTRIGEYTKAIINGDLTQIDLRPIDSGLREAQQVLTTVKGVGFVHLDQADIVRAPIVRDIVNAYEQYRQEGQQL